MRKLVDFRINLCYYTRMIKIELSQSTPQSALSWHLNLSYGERMEQRRNCGMALVGEFTIDRWSQFVDGMARFHQGVEYHDGTVFAEVPCGEKVFYFQTNPLAALIKVRSPLGAEIITWGRTHDGKILEAPALKVIRRTDLELGVDNLVFKPEHSKPKKNDKLGNLTVTAYQMSPEEVRGYCEYFFGCLGVH